MATMYMPILLASLLLIANHFTYVKSQIVIPYNLLLIKQAEFYILPFLAHELEEFDVNLGPGTTTQHFDGEFNWYKYGMNNVFRKWRAAEPDNPLAYESILYIMQHLPEVSQPYVHDMHFYGGGYMNHCFYFALLSPNPEGVEREPTGYLLEEINYNFGNITNLKKDVEDAMGLLRGSGYIWVVRVPGIEMTKYGPGTLKVITTSNQDSPIIAGLHPIICIDMWEHAYYLKHSYEKWKHLSDFWMVLDWTYVERLDQWWLNIDEEQTRADHRVELLKQAQAEAEAVIAEAVEAKAAAAAAAAGTAAAVDGDASNAAANAKGDENGEQPKSEL